MIGRFAPSPSGRMHLGNVFCALLAWLDTRSADGKMLLRIEDLDPDRCRRDYALQMQEDLQWLGLDWDAGGIEDDAFCQSHRDALYERAFQALVEQHAVYPCFCTRAQRAAGAPHRADGFLRYSGRCRTLSHEEIAHLQTLRAPSFRLRAPDGPYEFLDALQGAQHGSYADAGDFVIRRADGVFAYQLTVVVDDALMGVTNVVRGRDLLDSTPQQLLLYRLLDYPPPEFMHIPLLLAPDGRRLSKRDRDLDMGQLRTYRADEIVGYLAFLAGLSERYEPISPKMLVTMFDRKKLRQNDIILNSAVLDDRLR